MRLLLTGGHGFTGRHFENVARSAGHETSVLQSNLLDPAALKDEILSCRPEAVLHLAAISFVGHGDAQAFYEVNVIGTLNLLDALTALPQAPKAVLLASSANVYGNCEDSPISENQPPAPVNHYAASKLAMEHLARTYSGRLPVFFVRPFNYTGPGQDESFVIPKLVAHFARRAETVELGNLDVEREFNDVRFVCDAYLHLLERGVPGETYNVCTGNPITLQSAIELLSKLTGHRMRVVVNPAFVRPNEIRRLCGDPRKLHEAVGSLPAYSLSDTLGWMLDAAHA